MKKTIVPSMFYLVACIIMLILFYVFLLLLIYGLPLLYENPTKYTDMYIFTIVYLGIPTCTLPISKTFFQWLRFDESGITVKSILGLSHAYRWDEVKEVRLESYFISTGVSYKYFLIIVNDEEKYQCNGIVRDDSNITAKYTEKMYKIIKANWKNSIVNIDVDAENNQTPIKKNVKHTNINLWKLILGISMLILNGVFVALSVYFTLKNEYANETMVRIYFIILYVFTHIIIYVFAKYLVDYVDVYNDQIIKRNLISKLIVIDKKKIESIIQIDANIIIKSLQAQIYTYSRKKNMADHIKIHMSKRVLGILTEKGYM